jgi:DNA-damage-inducible protein D
MKREFIVELLEKVGDACYNYEGIECCNARDLQIILGYSK